MRDQSSAERPANRMRAPPTALQRRTRGEPTANHLHVATEPARPSHPSHGAGSGTYWGVARSHIYTSTVLFPNVNDLLDFTAGEFCQGP